ncbi:MAG TPA: CBS domain-containing protein, partial [Anaerolineae bacterium]
FSFTRPADWKRQRVESVVLVDTQTFNNVRGMVRQPRVCVFDHHAPRGEEEGWVYQLEEVGATTTLLVEKLQTAGLSLTAEEATLLLLGIYEDTGSLTYDTTTARDGFAAAWLLEQGAQLAVVRRFLNIPLTAAQRTLFDSLQAAVEWVEISGQSLVVTAARVSEDFDDEISSVVHRLREVLSPAGLFVLVQVRDGVQLVARSATEQVDVAVIATELGGGGHSRAAAAMITGAELAAVHQEVMNLLPKAVKPMATVAEIMSYGVQTVQPEMTVADAAALMQRFGYEGYPVVNSGAQRLVGLLTRRAVDRAMSHKLGRLPVSRIMKAGQVTVRPSDSVDRLQQLMLREGWGQVPVVDGTEEAAAGRLIGIVTRTDLLNFLFKPPSETEELDMRQLLEDTLSPAQWGMVLAVSEVAAAHNMPVYFVGGLVRDILLGKSPIDMDMVVEGDAIKLVRLLQDRYGGEIHTHSRFGTGKWFVPSAIWQAMAQRAVEEGYERQSEVSDGGYAPSVDFVTARTEFYTEPSALPEVSEGSIKLDLHRRDFTINTLAVRLDGAHLGELLDFYNGRRDLEEGVIRVLHSLSFVDDPTRILRAVRLEQRLGFTIEPRTAELMLSALPMLDRVTGDRIRHEIELAFREADPIPVMARLAELDVMSHIHPGLAWSAETAAFFQRVSELLEDPVWEAVLEGDSPAFLYFALWMVAHAQEVQEAVMDRLRVRKATREDVHACNQVLAALAELPSDARPSQVETALRPFRPRVLLVARAVVGDGPKAKYIERYYRQWRLVKTAVTGYDLREMGLKPGPQYTTLLDRLLAARLDGEVSSEPEERELLSELLQDVEEN